MLTRNLFLSTLEPGDRAALSQHLRPVQWSVGQTLFEEGDRVDTVFFPSNAVVSLMTVLRDGRSVENANVGFETGVELLNAVTDSHTTSRVVVLIGGDAAAMPADRLRACLRERPSLAMHVMEQAQGSACRCGQTVACNAFHTASQRLARWLLTTADRVGEDRFPITQDFLAGVMGIQRTTVTSVALGLKDQGLVDYSRGRLTILDRRGLTAEACECYTPADAAGAAVTAA